jgi:XRE family transcriptional regulator, regulator of sulfur utilization
MAPSVLAPIASNLKEIRAKRGISLSALAETAGISKSTLSALERGHGNPSLDTLWTLARALNVPLHALFTEHPHHGVHFLPLADAEVIADERGLLTRHLLSLHNRGDVEVYVVTLAPGARRESGEHGPGQVEHVIGMSGRVEVGPDEQPVVVRQGDLASYPCDVPHHYTAVGGPARFVVVQDYP